MGGAGANIFYPEPEPITTELEPVLLDSLLQEVGEYSSFPGPWPSILTYLNKNARGGGSSNTSPVFSVNLASTKPRTIKDKSV